MQWKRWFAGGATVPRFVFPLSALKQAGYHLEQKVELVVSEGAIIIRPSRKVEYELDALVGGITKANTHHAIDFGPPVGKEAL
jgi:antitoxin MazE